MLLKGDPTDKEYPKKLIENLVYKVFIYGKEIVTYLIYESDKAIKEINFVIIDKAYAELMGQPLSPILHQF